MSSIPTRRSWGDEGTVDVWEGDSCWIDGAVRCVGFPWSAQKKPRPASRCFRVDEVGRGCARIDPHCNREPGFFAIAIEKFFSFRPDWHRDDRASPLVRQYQTTLDSVLESHPELRACAAHCVHCGIRFLIHPRSAGRRNVRCPFGCRERHRREHANRRSAAYYRTTAGKLKKQRLNARRHRRFPAADGESAEGEARDDPVPPAPPCREHGPEESADAELSLEGVVLQESSVARSRMLAYVRMVVGLIDGIRLSLREVVDLLRRGLRQRSIAPRRRVDYVLAFLHQHPP
jgi:hypothetical protein